MSRTFRVYLAVMIGVRESVITEGERWEIDTDGCLHIYPIPVGHHKSPTASFAAGMWLGITEEKQVDYSLGQKQGDS